MKREGSLPMQGRWPRRGRGCLEHCLAMDCRSALGLGWAILGNRWRQLGNLCLRAARKIPRAMLHGEHQLRPKQQSSPL